MSVSAQTHVIKKGTSRIAMSSSRSGLHGCLSSSTTGRFYNQRIRPPADATSPDGLRLAATLEHLHREVAPPVRQAPSRTSAASSVHSSNVMLTRQRSHR